MSQNILITGAAGYIGGSTLADFISRKSGPIADSRIYASVRSEDQAQRLSKLEGVNVLLLDLSDDAKVCDAVLKSEIDIVLHIASSIDVKLATNLVNALGERKKVSGSPTYFVQSGVTAMFSVENGWPFGAIKDSDPTILEKDKEIGGQNPVRQTNIVVIERAKELGVMSFVLSLPHVYGTGSGEWSKLSSPIPAHVRASLANKQVHKFDVDANQPMVHIADLTALYALLTTKILQKEPIPSNENGHYFGFNHRASTWALMGRIATALHSRGLVPNDDVKIWASDEVAAESLNFPRAYVRAMGASTPTMTPVNAFEIGWKPQWSEEKCLANIDGEVQAALDLDRVKTSRYEVLFAAEK